MGGLRHVPLESVQAPGFIYSHIFPPLHLRGSVLSTQQTITARSLGCKKRTINLTVRRNPQLVPGHGYLPQARGMATSRRPGTWLSPDCFAPTDRYCGPPADPGRRSPHPGPTAVGRMKTTCEAVRPGAWLPPEYTGKSMGEKCIGF